MKKVKFGIIGIGNMGFAHFTSFMEGKIKNGVVTAIADGDINKLNRAKEKFGDSFKCYTDFNDLIDNADVDAILIAVPHFAHPDIAIRAFKRGLNVLCEKPAGVYTKHVKEMNEAAINSGKIYSMVYHHRTNPLFIKLKEMVSSKEYGEIRRVNWIVTNWFRSQRYYDSGSWRATWKGEGGGVLLNQCPHQIDLLQWICGMPNKVHAYCHFGKWHNIETEDDVTAYFEYPNGATGVFIASTADAPGTNRLEITLSKGKLVYENDKITATKLEEDLTDYIKTTAEGFIIPKATTTVIEPEGEFPEHNGVINNFANAILGIEPLFIDGLEGLNCVELLNGMLLSTWTNKAVALPLDDDEYYTLLKEKMDSSVSKNVESVTLDLSSSYKGAK